MIFRQRPKDKWTGRNSFWFIMWSEKYDNGIDRESPGGWGYDPDKIDTLSFKLELVL